MTSNISFLQKKNKPTFVTFASVDYKKKICSNSTTQCIRIIHNFIHMNGVYNDLPNRIHGDLYSILAN